MALLAATAVAGSRRRIDDRKKWTRQDLHAQLHGTWSSIMSIFLRPVGGMPAPPTSGLRGDDDGAASARAVHAGRTAAGLPGATAHLQEDPRRNLAAGYNIGRPTWGQVMSFRYSTYEQTSAL